MLLAGSQRSKAVGWDRSALEEVALTGALASVDKAWSENIDWGRLTAYSPLTGLRRAESVDDALKDERGWIWVHIADPTAEEVSELAAAVKVPVEVLSEDAGCMGDGLEDLDGCVVLTYARVRAAIGGQTLVSVDYSMGSGLVSGVVRRLTPDARITDVASALVDSATEAAAQALRAVEAEVSAIEQQSMGAYTGGGAAMLSRIGKARRSVLCAWRELQQRKPVVGGSRLVGLLSSCAHCEAALARAHAHYAAQLAVGQSRASERLAAVSSRWLLLAAVLLPMQYAAGLFGMNIGVPWKHNAEKKLNETNDAWFGIMACLVAAFLLAIVYARIRRLV
ncbi:hypothetical protein GGH94_005418 [Coemansia aciculifera]|uniref:Magnesium transporter n=2 Tax=Coemansia TaxID=4863 RepID=A0A9W8ILI7_9FUNG|nr:hypothetical protein GGH94_005418 [Coemansia aciculifera]KAJ2870720.1 hypothetical protein GGH93_005356 [Coemansia aciculifera]